MASNKFLILLALAAVVAVAFSQVQQGGGHSDQSGPHQNQGRVRRQIPEDEVQIEEVVDVEDIEVAGLQATWVDCDFTATPKLSCLDCNTRVICKPIGGLVRYCHNPRRPYCNNGLCSDIPSAECT